MNKNIVWATLLLCSPLIGMDSDENVHYVNPKKIQATHQVAKLIIEVSKNTLGQQTIDLRSRNILSSKYMQLKTGLILKDPDSESNRLQLYTPLGIYKLGTSTNPASVLKALQGNENIALEYFTQKVDGKTLTGYQVNRINSISLPKARFRSKQSYIPTKVAHKIWDENKPKDDE